MKRVYASRELIRLIEADGWYRVGQSGSHAQFRHPTKPGRVTIVHPKRDVPIGTAYSIFRQAGIEPPK